MVGMPAVRMTKGEVLDHVRRTIAELFELDLEDIRPESTIFDDLARFEPSLI